MQIQLQLKDSEEVSEEITGDLLSGSGFEHENGNPEFSDEPDTEEPSAR